MRKKLLTNLKSLMKGIISVGIVLSTLTGCSDDRTVINILTDDTLTVTYSGYNGSAKLKAVFNDNKIDYNKNNIQLEMFVLNIDISYDESASLSNGDTVTITANYDEDTANELDLNVKNDTYTVTIEGLGDAYSDADDVPDDIVERLKTVCYDKTQEETSDDETVEYDFYSFYYALNEETGENYGIVIFETTTTDSSGEESIWYMGYGVSNVTSEFMDLDDDSIYMEELSFIVNWERSLYYTFEQDDFIVTERSV